MKQVIITIDTEGHDGIDPIEHLIWGKTSDNEAYGIDHIMDLCENYSAKVLFFVDVAEAWDYGKEKIAQVIKHIRARGHDVGVHIHPDHMADKARPFLWEYNQDEQREILTNCTNLYVEITGEHPAAFRAGKYGANRDTLDILDELGYEFDFSQFYGQRWCGINPPVAYSLPRKYKSLTEIPVTIFNSLRFGSFRRYDKVDAIMDSAEFRHIMDRIAADNREIVVSLFYHSFSMLDWRENPDQPKFNVKEEKKFIDALKYVFESKDFEFITLNYLQRKKDNRATAVKETEDSINNITATKGFWRSAYFIVKRAYSIKKYNKKANYLISLLYCGGLFFITFLILVLFNEFT